MIRFTEEQQKIMDYSGGKMSISAVPGAGKTFITTHLVLKLLKDFPESKILILTYMNSAANNFKNRIDRMIDENGYDESLKKRFEVSTIHSLAVSIIDEAPEEIGFDENIQIIDEYMSNNIIGKLIDDFKYNEDGRYSGEYTILMNMYKNPNESENNIKEMDFFITGLVKDALQKIKNNGLDIDEVVSKNLFDKGLIKIILPIVENYGKYLNENGLIDYNDILLYAYRLLRDSDKVRQKLENRYTYVFEDECQDSNDMQSVIISYLTAKSGNLVRVGDINQSITGTFSASDPENFRQFMKDADINMTMTVSGRSSKVIINAANEFVKKITESFEPSICRNALMQNYIQPSDETESSIVNPPAEKSFIYHKILPNDEQEFVYIIACVKKFLEIYPKCNIGVLVKNNKDLDRLSSLFTQEGVEHDYLGDNASYKRAAIYRAGRIFEFLENPADREKFVSAVFACDRMFFDINGTDIKKLAGNYEILMNLFINEMEKSSVDEESLKAVSHELIEFVKEDMFDDSFAPWEQVAESLLRAVKNLVNIFVSRDKSFEELVLMQSAFICKNDFDKNLIQYLSRYIGYRISSEGDIDYSDITGVMMSSRVNPFSFIIKFLSDVEGYEPGEGTVTLCTYHKAKGMEWDYVFMTGLTENNFQSSIEKCWQGVRYKFRPRYKYPNKIINDEYSAAFSKAGISSKISNNRRDYRYDLIDENIRLFYVGITRAKLGLIMTSPEKRNEKKAIRTAYAGMIGSVRKGSVK